MIGSQVLNSTILGLKNITRKDIHVLESNGKILASTDKTRIGQVVIGVENFVESPAESQLMQGQQFFKVVDNNVCEYVVAINGEDEDAYKTGKITAFQLQGLIVAYKERYDKYNFIKNLLLDNLLLIDIYSRAKKLNIDTMVPRSVYLIESEYDKDIDITEILRNIFPNKNKDFIVTLGENSVVLIRDINTNNTKEEIELPAKMIVDSLSMEGIRDVRVAMGTPINDIKDVSASYKEAKLALDVGKIFNNGKFISNYTELGIGRLIYQLPSSLCKMFIDEVLNGLSVDSFDEETLQTVEKFFENNLNVSETSRQLYIHRNTLVYRLDKIHKLTGLDLRNFEDAITFKITLMVSTYLKHLNANNSLY